MTEDSVAFTITEEMRNSEGDDLWSEWYTCPSCGHEDVRPSSKFCNECGVKLRWELGEQK